jgi:3-mercaptopyruvate sulfurtransferase SseA
VALDLAKLGVTRVRPLAGGFPEWQKLGFPVEAIAAVVAASPSPPIGKSRG